MPIVGTSYTQDVEDLRRAIDAIDGVADEAPRMRTCLRLQVAGVLPGGVAKLRAADFDLSGSAILRNVPNLKVTVLARYRRGRIIAIRFVGEEAQDAKKALLASAASEGALFTPECVRNARKALCASLGRRVNAFEIQMMTELAAYEEVRSRMTMRR